MFNKDSLSYIGFFATCFIIASLWVFSSVAYAVEPPDIEVLGNGIVIPDGDTTPSLIDDTDFGSVGFNIPISKTFTIDNTGGEDLILNGNPIVQISGSSFFTVTAQPNSPVASGESTTFTIQFLSDSPEEHTATVTIPNNVSVKNPYDFSVKGVSLGPEISVLGNGIVINDGDTTPSLIDDTDFGSVGFGQTITKTFTVQNTGNANLTVGTIDISGVGSNMFSITVQPDNIVPASETTSFTIQFNASSTGEYTATITVPNSDNNKNPYDFSVKGVATVIVPTLSSPTTSSIETTSAVLGATIVHNGDDPIYDYGVYWHTSSPAESGTKCTMGSTDPGPGSYPFEFSESCGGMSVGTKIYFRGYATNSVDTGYTSEDYFYTEPLQSSNLTFSSVTYDSMTVSWDNDATSNGALVTISALWQQPPPFGPVDGYNYNAIANPFNGGDNIDYDYYVVYQGSGSSVDIKSLSPGTTYNISVYAYSGSGIKINYQQDNPETANQMTARCQWTIAHLTQIKLSLVYVAVAFQI
jgi:hypothetical protein